ncbi:MAG: LuxR C-terminal-related transcriptional regulator, partial [Bacteroidota bacterium]
PWYASRTAKWVYALMIALGILGLFLIPRWRFEQEKQRLESNIVAVEQAKEKEISALKTLSLQEEIRHKNEELASATMHLVQKNEILLKVKSSLETLQKEIENKEAQPQIKRLIRLVKQDIRLDKDWEQFAHHFDQVHVDFFKRLRDAYPQLTPKDHRLCAYLRMNLSTKEIAPLMNISVRGVEISRYRLRKKLDLNHETNLTEFMMQY